MVLAVGSNTKLKLWLTQFRFGPILKRSFLEINFRTIYEIIRIHRRILHGFPSTSTTDPTNCLTMTNTSDGGKGAPPDPSKSKAYNDVLNYLPAVNSAKPAQGSTKID